MWVRVLRVLLVVPLLYDLVSTDNSREITDEHGRTLELTAVESVSTLPTDHGITVDARIATLWDNDSRSIQQTGLLAPANSSRKDDVSTIKFVVWSGNGLPEMQENGSYRLIGALTDEYNGRAEIKLDSRSEIRPLR